MVIGSPVKLTETEVLCSSGANEKRTNFLKVNDQHDQCVSLGEVIHSSKVQSLLM